MSAPKLLERFEIVLDNEEGVYFAGQEITGKVLIECTEPKQVSEVLFEVKGRARTSWTKSRKTCSSNEAYFCEQFNTSYSKKLPKAKESRESTRGEGKDGDRTSKRDSTKLLGHTLPPGVHQIPFSYTLSKSLPTSFEGEFGFVRYTCRAICERPWDFDIVCFRAFTVIGIEDLNADAETLSLPLETRSTHLVSAMCMKLGSVSTEMRLARGGYTPGEDILVNARVKNGSKRTLRGLELQLCQTVVYKTFAGVEQMKTTRHVVQRVSADQTVKTNGGEFEWKAKAISVPAVPPRLMHRCRLIDVQYCVELHCKSPQFCMSLPVVIGTIPLLSNYSIVNKISVQSNGNAVKSTLAASTSADQVRVMVTDEGGKTTKGQQQEEDDRLDTVTEKLFATRKRVRMPSSVLSELYPVLPSPYYKELYSGPVRTVDDREKKFQFGEVKFAPKYPFYE